MGGWRPVPPPDLPNGGRFGAGGRVRSGSFVVSAAPRRNERPWPGGANGRAYFTLSSAARSSWSLKTMSSEARTTPVRSTTNAHGSAGSPQAFVMSFA